MAELTNREYQSATAAFEADVRELMNVKHLSICDDTKASILLSIEEEISGGTSTC